MDRQGTQERADAARQLHRVLEEKTLATVFQPIIGFREGHIIGYEALVRGPRGSLLQTPAELFAAAAEEGLAVELNLVCIQQMLRTFAASGLAGRLFLNVSPQLILQRTHDQERAAQYMRSIGLPAERVVIELTED